MKKKSIKPVISTYEETPEETKEYAIQRKLYFQWKDTEILVYYARTKGMKAKLTKEAEGYRKAFEQRVSAWKQTHPELVKAWEDQFKPVENNEETE